MKRPKNDFEDTNALIIFIRLWKKFNRVRKIQSIGLLFLMIISGYAELLSLGSIIPFLSILNNSDNALNFPFLKIFPIDDFSNEQVLILTCLLFIIAVFLAGIIKCISLYLIGKFSSRVGNKLSSKIFSNILEQEYDYHLNTNSSNLISSLTIRINGTVFGINTMFQIAAAFIVVISLITGLFLINLKVTLFMIGVFVFIYTFLIKTFKNEITTNAVKEDFVMNRRIQVIQESLGFIRNIVIDGNQNIFIKKYNKLDSEERDLITRNNFLGASPRFILEMIGMALIALIGTLWTIGVDSSSNIIPLLGAIALAAQRLLPALQQIYAGWVQIKTTNAGTISVIELLEKPIPKKNIIRNYVTFEKSLKFNNVDFQYKNFNQKILKNINLEIKKGEHIGIIGKTGSGKTTLFDLLMCLLYPSNGFLSVDGKILDNSNVANWRSQISHVPQNIYLSDGSIRENIAFGMNPRQIDDDLVKECSSIARIARYIDTLPNKYNTKVGERGAKLSGGQIQRIGIARALYKKSSILLLDEATSALDSSTEKKVLEGIQNRMNSMTLIMIAHRLSTLKNCDRIIKLESGEVVHNGPYIIKD